MSEPTNETARDAIASPQSEATQQQDSLAPQDGAPSAHSAQEAAEVAQLDVRDTTRGHYTIQEARAAQALRRQRSKEAAHKAKLRKEDELRVALAQASQLRSTNRNLQIALEEQHAESQSIRDRVALLVDRHRALAAANMHLQAQLAHAREIHPDLVHILHPINFDNGASSPTPTASVCNPRSPSLPHPQPHAAGATSPNPSNPAAAAEPMSIDSGGANGAESANSAGRQLRQPLLLLHGRLATPHGPPAPGPHAAQYPARGSAPCLVSSPFYTSTLPGEQWRNHVALAEPPRPASEPCASVADPSDPHGRAEYQRTLSLPPRAPKRTLIHTHSMGAAVASKRGPPLSPPAFAADRFTFAPVPPPYSPTPSGPPSHRPHLNPNGRSPPEPAQPTSSDPSSYSYADDTTQDTQDTQDGDYAAPDPAPPPSFNLTSLLSLTSRPSPASSQPSPLHSAPHRRAPPSTAAPHPAHLWPDSYPPTSGPAPAPTSSAPQNCLHASSPLQPLPSVNSLADLPSLEDTYNIVPSLPSLQLMSGNPVTPSSSAPLSWPQLYALQHPHHQSDPHAGSAPTSAPQGDAWLLHHLRQHPPQSGRATPNGFEAPSQATSSAAEVLSAPAANGKAHRPLWTSEL